MRGLVLRSAAFVPSLQSTFLHRTPTIGHFFFHLVRSATSSAQDVGVYTKRTALPFRFPPASAAFPLLHSLVPTTRTREAARTVQAGYRFAARRVRAPPPFLGPYIKVPTGEFRHFLKTNRFPGREFLETTTLVDYCMSVAPTPLPCEPLGETSNFEVLDGITVGDGPHRGCGSQVVVCKREGHAEPLVAKFFDPLYYPFFDDDFPSIPNNVVSNAEHDFALESAAYIQLDGRLGGRLVPQFHGSWVLDLPLKHVSRSVGFVLMERLGGIPLDKLDPAHYSRDERLRVLALSMEAEVELFHAGVLHYDIAPRNVICSGANLQSEDLSVKIIDFGLTSVLPLLGAKAPCESKPLPESPLESFWNGRQVDMRQWEPEGMGQPEWEQWLQERWGGRQSICLRLGRRGLVHDNTGLFFRQHFQWRKRHLWLGFTNHMPLG